MPMFHVIAVVFALVCFVSAAFPTVNPNWNRLVATGLAFLAASMLSW